MKSRLKKLIFILVLVFLLLHCSSKDGKKSITLKAEKGPFQVTIPAFGELKAVESTPIRVAAHIQGGQILAWLQDENSFVKKGDILLRLSSTWYNEKIREEEFAIRKLDLEIQEKIQQLKKEKEDLKSQIDIANREKEMANQYNVTDEMVFSRNEIIDKAVDLEYLEKKGRFLQEKSKKMEEKSRAELQLLELKKKNHLIQQEQHKSALEALIIRAPHDGLFVLQRTWRGKPRVGMEVYRGMQLGELPNLEKMEGKLYVLESEASGLKKDLAASLVLDSLPGRTFRGQVKSVDSIAKNLERESPLKYFEVIVSLDETQRATMKPGCQVRAMIYVEEQENVISVPNQALFIDDSKPYLLVKKGKDFEKRAVKIGTRSTTRTIILSGIEEGEEVALGDTKKRSGQ